MNESDIIDEQFVAIIWKYWCKIESKLTIDILPRLFKPFQYDFTFKTHAFKSNCKVAKVRNEIFHILLFCNPVSDMLSKNA